MQVSHVEFLAPKAGYALDECEDAIAWADSGEGDGFPWTFAVADGATESSFSREWAQYLVRDFRAGSASLFVSQLPKLAQRWKKSVSSRLPAELPWFAEEKLEQGAYAALLGLVLDRSRSAAEASGRWYAIASGDCCLIQVRADTVLARFPIDSAEQFSKRPQLLGTRLVSADAASRCISTTAGEWTAGDDFYVMSDALAAWFYRRLEAGDRPWLLLREWTAAGPTVGQQHLLEWLHARREEAAIRNDDVALVSVNVERA